MGVEPVNILVKEPSCDPVIADIRDQWDWIRPALLEIKSDTPTITWRPEDVYAECVYGNALLYIAAEGFAITTVLTDQYTKDRTLHFWICWAKRKGGKNVLKYLPFFKNVAQELECKFFELGTSVKELDPYFKINGWTLTTRTYRREVHGK